MNKDFWNDRYKVNDTTYGWEPNEFFKEQISKAKPGVLLLPAEGEGRNALYAASLGWKVKAYDFSEVAKEKALDQARKAGLTTLEYEVADLGELELKSDQFDFIAFIYMHLPEATRKHLYAQCIKSLKPGGTLVIEGFSKNQLQYQSGGPKDESLLYSQQQLLIDFDTLEIVSLEEKLPVLNEGLFHKGPASVVRMVAKKA